LKTGIISSSAKSVGPARHCKLCVLLQLALVLVAGTAPLAQGQQYKSQRLNPPGSTYSFASGLNSTGVVVGAFVDSSSAYEGFAYRNGNYKGDRIPRVCGFH
jgi:hypothetical protein